MNEDDLLKALEEEAFPKTAFEFELGSALMVILDALCPGEFVDVEEDQCYCDACVENLISFAADVLQRWHQKYGGHVHEFIGTVDSLDED